MKRHAPHTRFPALRFLRRFRVGGGVAVLLLMAAIGSAHYETSSAAVGDNPIGAIDYCTLENNTTVLYGWASDPDAVSTDQAYVSLTVRNVTYTSGTTLAGYRDGPINTFLAANRPRDKRPGTYGFRIPISNLYKGTSVPLSGTAINIGVGVNESLSLNNRGEIDGSPAATFSGGVIPEACLASQQAPSPPAPVTPPSTTTPRPAAPKPTTPVPTTQPGVPVVSAPVPINDAGVAIGTLAAEVRVPAGGASSARIKYGVDPASLTLETADKAITGESIDIVLPDLLPATAYTYVVVRTINGQPVTSPPASFTTEGFMAILSLKNKPDSVVTGITATLTPGNKKVNSNSNGELVFSDLKPGSYEVVFTYQGREFRETVAVDSQILGADAKQTPTIAIVRQAINVGGGSSDTAGLSESSTPVVPIILGGIALGSIIGGFVFKRKATRARRTRPQIASAPPAYPAAPAYNPQTPSSTYPTYLQPGADPQAAHAGESLKAMVLESMREEARRRRDNQPPSASS